MKQVRMKQAVATLQPVYCNTASRIPEYGEASTRQCSPTMRATHLLRTATGGAGFWARTFDVLKRNTERAIKFQAITDTFADLPIAQFRTPADVKSIKVFSDAELGGFSTASLTLIAPHHSYPTELPPPPPPPCPGSPPHPYALFWGSISTELPPTRPEIQRSGYAAFRTRSPKATLFGSNLMDIDPYTYLALRINSDGSRYYVNLQTDGIVPTDIHQHRLLAENPGGWETVYIPFKEFVRTNNGVVVWPADLLRSRLRTVGIGLIDRVPGPFRLAVDRIWATDRIRPEDEQPPERNLRDEVD